MVGPGGRALRGEATCLGAAPHSQDCELCLQFLPIWTQGPGAEISAGDDQALAHPGPLELCRGPATAASGKHRPQAKRLLRQDQSCAP